MPTFPTFIPAPHQYTPPNPSTHSVQKGKGTIHHRSVILHLPFLPFLHFTPTPTPTPAPVPRGKLGRKHHTCLHPGSVRARVQSQKVRCYHTNAPRGNSWADYRKRKVGVTDWNVSMMGNRPVVRSAPPIANPGKSEGQARKAGMGMGVEDDTSVYGGVQYRDSLGTLDGQRWIDEYTQRRETFRRSEGEKSVMFRPLSHREV